VSYTIKLLPGARLDLKEIMEYYEEQQSGLATRFFKNLLPTIRRIRQSPVIFQVRYKNVRQADEQVVIIAATHSSQNPQVWKDRTS